MTDLVLFQALSFLFYLKVLLPYEPSIGITHRLTLHMHYFLNMIKVDWYNLTLID